jgi:hypothetical protein
MSGVSDAVTRQPAALARSSGGGARTTSPDGVTTSERTARSPSPQPLDYPSHQPAATPCTSHGRGGRRSPTTRPAARSTI